MEPNTTTVIKVCLDLSTIQTKTKSLDKESRKIFITNLAICFRIQPLLSILVEYVSNGVTLQEPLSLAFEPLIMAAA